jgi:hypothetical protein
MGAESRIGEGVEPPFLGTWKAPPEAQQLRPIL